MTNKILKVISLFSLTILPSLATDVTISSNLSGMNNKGYLVNGDIENFTVNNGITVSYTNIIDHTDGSIAFNNGVSSTITNFINNGTIIGKTTTNGIGINSSNGTITTLTNNGTIQGNYPIYLNNPSRIDNLINNSGATISGAGNAIFVSNANTSIGKITNYGTIISNDFAIRLFVSGATIDDVVNSGTIQSTTNYDAFGLVTGTKINNTLENTGTIIGTRNGILNAGTIGTIKNSGTITGTASEAIENSVSGTITSIINTGSLNGSTYGIQNSGTITTLRNDQNNLKINGTLPTNYNFIANSTTDYGKLIVTSHGGSTTNFGIHSVSDITTYNDVISGVTSSNFSSLNGTYGAWNWTLSDTNTDNSWDLTLNGNLVSSVNSQNNSVGNNAANILNQNANMLNLFSSQNTNKQRSEAVSQTLPLLIGSSGSTTFNSLSDLNRVIRTRIQSLSGLSSGDEISNEKSVWVKTFGSIARQDNVDEVVGFEAKTFGITFGTDKTLKNDWLLGFALAYAQNNVNSNSSSIKHDLDTDLYQFIVYGNKELTQNTEFTSKQMLELTIIMV